MYLPKLRLRMLLLSAALIGFSAVPSLADTIVVGTTGGGNRFPFGVQASPTPPPTAPNYQPGATYQQLYDGNVFGGGAVTITQLAFASRTTNGLPGVGTFDFTLRLGTSATPIEAPSGTFALNRTGDLTTVFSGTLTVNLLQTDTFDLIINLTTPFTFNPNNGDLLLDVIFNAPTTFSNGNLFFSSVNTASSALTTRVFNPLPSATGTASQFNALRTRFEFMPFQTEPIPEPATMILLGTGLVGLVAAARRQRRQGE